MTTLWKSQQLRNCTFVKNKILQIWSGTSSFSKNGAWKEKLGREPFKRKVKGKIMTRLRLRQVENAVQPILGNWRHPSHRSENFYLFGDNHHRVILFLCGNIQFGVFRAKHVNRTVEVLLANILPRRCVIWNRNWMFAPYKICGLKIKWFLRS